MEEEAAIRPREGAKKRKRPCSSSYVAVRDALFQLTRLNDFRAEKIGGGFYADVFKVTHKSSGEVMVLKMNKNRKYSRQMLCEIQLMNRLSHPNILKFKGSCVHEGQLHALTEYINGGSLEDLLHDRSVDLSWSVRVKIALDMAKGMAYLHSRGVFHRDLSSRNCLIQRLPDGTMKTIVADFGLAAKIKRERHRSHTEVVGSPYWMAPECLNGKQYCEQADVFSYGIVLAEIMARIPADPDFMPRTRIYGMDFEALHKMCLGCPEDLWELMVRCCQIDPDERCMFHEAVEILEQVVMPEESKEIEEDDLRACFSEPVLMLQDSDDNLSFTSGQSSLNPVNSTESIEKSSIAQSSAEDAQLELHPQHDATESSASVAEGYVSLDREPPGSSSYACSAANYRSKMPSVDMAASQLVQQMSTQTLLDSDDEEGANKGDSGIDPGELFVCLPISVGEKLGMEAGMSSVAASYESTHHLPHTQGPTGKEMEEKEEGRNNCGVAPAHLLGPREAEDESGGNTPLCPSPTIPTNTGKTHCRGQFEWEVSPQILLQEKNKRTGIQHDRSVTSIHLTPSPDSIPPPATPNDCCFSPNTPSSASDVSFYLPQPSTPWAPPPSPVHSGFYSLSSSLPSSPTQKRHHFRLSGEVQEAMFPPFDPISLASSSDSNSVVYLRSKTASPLSQPQYRCSLRNSHGTALPPFPEDLELNDQVCLNLEEKFSHLGLLHRRTRSSSNPTPTPVVLQSGEYSLTLARYPTDTMCNSNASSFKCYSIKTRQNYRLSSSQPDLTPHNLFRNV